MNRPTYTKNMLTDYGLGNMLFSAIFAACESEVLYDVDLTTDEVNATLLAESVAAKLGHMEWLDEESHPLWDIAAYVSEKTENDIKQIGERNVEELGND